MQNMIEDDLASNIYSLRLGDYHPVSSTASTNTDSGFVDNESGAVRGADDPSEQINHGKKNSILSSLFNPSFLSEAYNWFTPDDDGDNDLLISLTHADSDYHMKVAALIIDNAPDSSFLNARNNGGMAAITVATIYNNHSAVRRLRLAGANPNITDGYGNSALHYGAMYGHVQVLIMLCTTIDSHEVKSYNAGVKREILPIDLNARNCDGKTALYLAVERRQIEIIKVLRSLGVDANVTENSAGRTALHEAVERGFLDCAAELLKISTIDVNACNYAGRTSLDCTERLTEDVRKQMEEHLTHYGAQHGSRDSSDNDDDDDLDDD